MELLYYLLDILSYLYNLFSYLDNFKECLILDYKNYEIFNFKKREVIDNVFDLMDNLGQGRLITYEINYSSFTTYRDVFLCNKAEIYQFNNTLLNLRLNYIYNNQLDYNLNGYYFWDTLHYKYEYRVKTAQGIRTNIQNYYQNEFLTAHDNELSPGIFKFRCLMNQLQESNKLLKVVDSEVVYVHDKLVKFLENNHIKDEIEPQDIPIKNLSSHFLNEMIKSIELTGL